VHIPVSIVATYVSIAALYVGINFIKRKKKEREIVVNIQVLQEMGFWLNITISRTSQHFQILFNMGSLDVIVGGPSWRGGSLNWVHSNLSIFPQAKQLLWPLKQLQHGSRKSRVYWALLALLICLLVSSKITVELWRDRVLLSTGMPRGPGKMRWQGCARYTWWKWQGDVV